MLPPMRVVRSAPARRRTPRRRAARERLEVDERRAQLLALGLAVFSERPYDNIAVDDLAHAAGVSKGLLYHYFPTKRDYYVASLREGARQLLEETAPSALQGTPEERVRAGIETYLGFVARRGAAYVTLMRGGIGFDPEVAAIVEGVRRAFVDRILAHLPGERLAPLVTVSLRGWVGLVEAMSIEWVSRRDPPAAAIASLAATALFDLLRSATDVAASPGHRSPPSGDATRRHSTSGQVAPTTPTPSRKRKRTRRR
jgi:AcrR family transcriptional regulator